MVINKPGSIRHCALITAALANTDQWRWRKTTDPRYHHLTERVGIRCQTDPITRLSILDLGWPVKANDVINCDADNTNNAQIEDGLFWIDYGGTRRLIAWDPPPGMTDVEYLNVTGATTVTASAWSVCALTWPALETTDTYRIVGLAAAGATPSAARLQFPGGGERPGVPATDAADAQGIVWGDFGTFVGGNEPNAEYLCAAGDTAQEMTFVVQKI